MHSRARVFRDRNGFRSWNLLTWASEWPKRTIQNVKVTSKRLDYYIEITNRERSFSSNRQVKVERGQLWSDPSLSWTQQHFLIATECSHARSRKFPRMSVASKRMYLIWDGALLMLCSNLSRNWWKTNVSNLAAWPNEEVIQEKV